MEDEKRSMEEEVFKALDHQLRRDILRYIGESHDATFTQILKTTETSDSPTLSYHLRALSPFLQQKESKYSLSPVGKSAYALLLKTTEYGSFTMIHRKKMGVIIGTTFLWVCAIAASLVLDVDFFLSTIILPVLGGTSLYVIYELFE